MSLESLVEWAKANGAVLSLGIEFREFSRRNYGGFCKSCDLDGEKPTIKVPTTLAITGETAIKSFGEYEQVFRNACLETVGVNSVLKLFLCRERSSQKLGPSFFRAYLEMLPGAGDSGSPYFWTAEDKEMVRGTNLGSSLRENIAVLVEEWWLVINLMPQDMPKPAEHWVNMKFYYEFKFYTDDDLYRFFVEDSEASRDNWTSFPNFLWASYILKSRSFPAYLLKGHIDGTSDMRPDEAVLLPLIDLLNHSISARVTWFVSREDLTTYFTFESESGTPGQQLYNNYGMKGNEELLLAYGFVIPDNSADSAALKLKVDSQLVPEIQKAGIDLPKVSEYTTSVTQERKEAAASSQGRENDYEDGILFFITNDNLPDNLIKLFQFLVKTRWEPHWSLRSRLAGLNQLRFALDAKQDMISTNKIPSNLKNALNITIYLNSQRQIYSTNIKKIKRLEKKLLDDPDNKQRLISLKKVYKTDTKLQQALLISLGIASFDQLQESQFQDQCWLLYLIRCYNRDAYVDSENDDDHFLPQWIQQEFVKIKQHMDITPAMVVQYQELYNSLLPNLAKIVPEIFTKGSWGVEEFVVSAKVLDSISFTRGKEKECILVKPEPETGTETKAETGTSL